jgi:Icc-related predicted phosphoesterase
MTKILCFSDIHNDEESLKILRKKFIKNNPEILVCAGDIATFGLGFSKIIKKLDFGVPLLIIPGNHESVEQIENAERRFRFVKNIHDRLFTIKGLHFFGFGGSNLTPFNTPFEMTETQIKKLLKKSYKDGKDSKLIFVSHAPPYKTKLDKINNSSVGSIELRKFIEKFQPALNICGHIHENAGIKDKIKKTKIINPGPEGKILELR